MKWILLLLLVQTANASSFSECIFNAKVMGVTKKDKLLKVNLMSSENPALCDSFLGVKELKLDRPKSGEVKIKFFQYSGMGPNGPVNSEKWEILN